MLDAYYYVIKKKILDHYHQVADLKPLEIDWYLRQYYTVRGEEDDGLIPYLPAIYVEILPIAWRTLPRSIQRAVMAFRLHILTETVHADERNFVISEAGDSNSDHLYYRGLAYQALMNQRAHIGDLPASIAATYGGPYIGPKGMEGVIMESIVRTGSPVTGEQLGNFILSVEEFQSVVTDYTAVVGSDKAENVELEIKCDP